ncbi:unnamed protein product [Spirodela intermedia]|uniref:Calcineurin-like phosphoesterase domain-containing protein n=1 Tax=Spirodela intermedia TaxID=51605 RepID=A0A7I8JKP9_SPIIN|nr:unnamed protein product [Spirodela intermedia]CAA6670355.1 unnamed protein product [Spirodela intermedia]
MGGTTRCRDVLPSQFAGCTDLNSTRFLQRMIHAEKPDLIVFSGDNIFGSSTRDAAESLFGAFRPAMVAKLPWAAILGNHDQESTMTRAELMAFISLMDYSLSRIDGFGNYNLTVHGAAGSPLVNSSLLNLYLLDSGDRAVVGGRRTYGWIKESQLHWLRAVSEELQGSSPVPAPALAFFHIPIPEVRELWFRKILGQYQEAVACSSVNSGVLKTLASMGDVKAVFAGHDHLNDFCGEIGGVMLCYGGGFGYHGYGKAGWPRRARMIQSELRKDGGGSWAGVGRIRTWKRLDDEALTKIEELVIWESPTRKRSRDALLPPRGPPRRTV